MKLLLPLIFSLAIAGCSPDQSHSPPTGASKSEVFEQFVVTFAVVKIPNSIMEQHGCRFQGTNGFDFGTVANRTKFAAYILAHTNEFSFTTSTGNIIPIVHTHQQTSVKFILDPKIEKADLEKYGIQTSQFEASLDVQEADEQGYVRCQAFYSFQVHLKEPIGNSTDQGGSGPGPLEGLCRIGQPGLAPLFQTKESSLWALSELIPKQ